MNRIHVGDLRIGKEEKEVIGDIMNSSRVSEGKYTRQFEKEWAKFLDVKYSVAVNSGTSALITGLTALKNHPEFDTKKNKIITSPLTYIATSNAIVHSGYDPVYVDINKDTFDINVENIKECLENNPDSYGLILPVHLMGFPCRIDEINKIARKHGMEVLEDCAQAHGTIYKDKIVGSFSKMAIHSFYIAHNIQVGELGSLNSDDRGIITLARRIKANGRLCECDVCVRGEGLCPYRDKPVDPRFQHNLIGYNFKTTEFQTGMALAQLKKIDFIIKKRQENVKYLNESLEELDSINTPNFSDKVSYLGYPVVIKDGSFNRGKILNLLEGRGIEARPLFGCIPLQQESFSHLKKKYENKLPNAEFVGKNAFYIGCHQYLKKEDLDYIIKIFRDVLK